MASTVKKVDAISTYRLVLSGMASTVLNGNDRLYYKRDICCDASQTGVLSLNYSTERRYEFGEISRRFGLISYIFTQRLILAIYSLIHFTASGRTYAYNTITGERIWLHDDMTGHKPSHMGAQSKHGGHHLKSYGRERPRVKDSHDAMFENPKKVPESYYDNIQIPGTPE
jgi:hypothetical protein